MTKSKDKDPTVHVSALELRNIACQVQIVVLT
jgi:hypothetical protein